MGMKGRLAFGAVVGIAVIGTVSANAGGGAGHGGSAGGGKTSPPSSASAGHRSGGTRGAGGAAAAEEKKGLPASSMDGDAGVYRVGTDIAPGTYTSTGDTDGSCSWERTRDAGHGHGSIIAHGHVRGPAVVTISPSDAYFTTDGCGDWKRT